MSPFRPSERASNRRITPARLLIACALLLVGSSCFRPADEPVPNESSTTSGTDSADPKSPSRSVSPPPKEPQIRLVQALEMENAKYVGAEVCRECHDERVSDFQLTSHARTSRLPEFESSDPRFAGDDNRLVTSDPELIFEMKLEDGQATQSALRSNEPMKTEPIEIVYGAGDFDEDYMYWQDDELFQLPVAYVRSLSRWCNAPGYVDGRANFDRPVPPRCLECHTTYVDHHAGTTNSYDHTTMLLGVSCERCHGPGELHVNHHRKFPKETRPEYILQPGEMTRSQSLDLCGQCHSNANKRKTAPFSYRPGDALEDHFRIDENNFPEQDHTANQHRYLQESACFEASASMNCVTCHDPHLSREYARPMAMESCKQCHQPVDCGEHTKLPEPLRNDCVDCHMPSNYVNNISFDMASDQYVPVIVRHEHRIAVYEDATRRVKLRWHEQQDSPESQAIAKSLRQELIDEKSTQADALFQAHRYLASAGVLREALRLAEDESLRLRLQEVLQARRENDLLMRAALKSIDEGQHEAAIQQLRDVIRTKPNHATAHGKLGLELAETGKIDEAIEHLRLVAEIDPDNGYGLAMLGYIHFVNQDWDSAENYYLQAAELEPYSAKIQSFLAQLAMKRDDLFQARRHFQKVLEIEPQNSGALATLINLFLQKNRLPDAIYEAELCVERLGKDNAEILELTANLYLQVGKLNEAVELLKRARDAVEDERARAALDRRVKQLEAAIR